jgi:hypothetical protein
MVKRRFYRRETAGTLSCREEMVKLRHLVSREAALQL